MGQVGSLAAGLQLQSGKLQKLGSILLDFPLLLGKFTLGKTTQIYLWTEFSCELICEFISFTFLEEIFTVLDNCFLNQISVQVVATLVETAV